MLILFTILLFIIVISRVIEEISHIPATLTIIVTAFILTFVFPDIFQVTSQSFQDILYLMLPIILLPDVLNLSTKELKRNYKPIIYLSVVAVVVSISFAALITPFLLPNYSFTIGMLIALFSMLMATDAITVNSIMSKFKLPKQLKMYAESESLFNDITALIIFYFIAIPLINENNISFFSINLMLIKVLLLSIIIGAFIAYAGYLVIKILTDSFDQFIIVYLVVILSFLVAEYFHIAGILSIISSVLMFKYLIKKDISDQKSLKNSNNPILNFLKKYPSLSKKEYRGYKKEAIYIGIFANTIVFSIVANIIDLSLLQTYLVEIFIIFALTTTIRFGLISLMIGKMKLPFRWNISLTLAGTKGALAIIMVHSLPQDFIYKQMFEAVIIGNVLLSTFVYTITLMFHINNNKEVYEKDIFELENKQSKKDIDQLNKSLVQLIEKDQTTHAYNKTFIDDILQKELDRAQRYKLELSIVYFKIYEKQSCQTMQTLYEYMGKVVQNKIRTNDYFGKINDDEFLIITTNTSLSGAMILAEKTNSQFDANQQLSECYDIYFGITQYELGDVLDSIYERLNDAIERGKQKTGEKIEIEI